MLPLPIKEIIILASPAKEHVWESIHCGKMFSSHCTHTAKYVIIGQPEKQTEVVLGYKYAQFWNIF